MDLCSPDQFRTVFVVPAEFLNRSICFNDERQGYTYDSIPQGTVMIIPDLRQMNDS